MKPEEQRTLQTVVENAREFTLFACDATICLSKPSDHSSSVSHGCPVVAAPSRNRVSAAPTQGGWTNRHGNSKQST